MKLKLTILAALSGLSFAQESSDWTQDVKDAMVLYEDADSFIRKLYAQTVIQFQVADVQPNGSNGENLKDGASPVNQEFRRVWVGFTLESETDTTFHSFWRVGGMPSRESYTDGDTYKNYTYAGFFDIWLKQEIRALKGSSIKVGKMATQFTDDYITSNTQIKTIERSVLTDQYGFESNWGVEFRYEPQKNNYLFLQLLANDRAAYAKSLTHSDVYRDGRGVKGEFGWEDKFFAILGGSYVLDKSEEEEQRISFQYAHDFNNIYDGKREASANCLGMSTKDAISLGHYYQQGKWSLANALVVNIEMAKADEESSGNNIGYNFRPVYAMSPHVDLVAQYTMMTGDGSCKLGAHRYISAQTTAPQFVDSINSFYLGANYYYSAKNPNSAKLMTGIEYTTARKGGDGVYSGWTYTTAIRFAF